MAKTSTELSERQREQALERFAVIRPCVEEGVSQVEVAREHGVSSSTVRRWIKRYPRAGVGGSGERGTSRSRALSRFGEGGDRTDRGVIVSADRVRR